LERYELSAESLLFIDDRADNVAMAHELGIQAVQFTTPEALEVDLIRLGVL
jgi:2-haloacid dehalogenase